MVPPPKKRGGKSKADAEASAPSEPTDETAEYELGDDFLADLEEDEELEDEELVDEHEVEEDEALEDEAEEDLEEAEDEYDDAELEDDYDEEGEPVEEEGELEEVVGAETQEWDGSGDEEQTLVASAGARIQQARSKITSGFDAVGGEKITSGFRAVGRHIRFPLWARFLTASAVIIAAVGTATAASLLLYLGDIADDLKFANTEVGKEIGVDITAVEGGAPQTIMILGSDKRPEDKGSDFRGLSDTTMLLRLDPDRGAIALFSLPRDLKVEISGYGVAKLNEAYATGGPASTLRTVKQLTGLEINPLVNVDFEGFARAVNSIDCVYVDVDRRYFNSNEGKPAALTYDEIDIQPGYQALCGFDALDYARYRHTDNDVVRAARQQDFLREARQRVPPEVVFAERKELIKIFTKHTTSDIDSASEMLEVLKLFIEARDAELQEVHFEGDLGPSFVTATPQQIKKAVNQFLGIEATPGPPAETAAPEDPSRAGDVERAPDASGATPATPAQQRKAKRKAQARKRKRQQARGSGPAELVDTTFGRKLARGIQRRRLSLPTYYPTKLELGTDFAQKPRVYKINGSPDALRAPGEGERAAYKWVFSRPALGEYYGFMATRWKDPPILDNPSETREIGDREYKLYYDGDRLRLVAWQTDEGSFWVSNTLIQSLSDREMLGIARGMRELPLPGA